MKYYSISVIMDNRDEFTIDKSTIDTLSSETRLQILSSLQKRRKTNAELAKELSLAPPTVLHHLEVLKQANLVAPAENEHKWIYYDLTPFGRALLEPGKKIRVSILLSSALTIMVAVTVLVTYITMPSLNVRPWIPVAGDPFFLLVVVAVIAVIVQVGVLIQAFKGWIT